MMTIGCATTFDVMPCRPKKVIHFLVACSMHASLAYMSEVCHVSILIRKGFQSYSVPVEDTFTMVRCVGLGDAVMSA